MMDIFEVICINCLTCMSDIHPDSVDTQREDEKNHPWLWGCSSNLTSASTENTLNRFQPASCPGCWLASSALLPWWLHTLWLRSPRPHPSPSKQIKGQIDLEHDAEFPHDHSSIFSPLFYSPFISLSICNSTCQLTCPKLFVCQISNQFCLQFLEREMIQNESWWKRFLMSLHIYPNHRPLPRGINQKLGIALICRFVVCLFFNTFKLRVSTASQAQRRCSLGILLLTFMTFNTISKDNLSFLIIKNCMLCAALEVTDWLSTHSKQWLILLMVKWDFNCFRPLNDSSHDLN